MITKAAASRTQRSWFARATRVAPAFAFVAAIVAAPAPAHAAPPSSAANPDRVAARELAEAGQDALDSNDFATALDRFTRADELIHAPTLLLGVARAQAGLGHWTDALETYARIVHERIPPGSPPAFTVAVSEARAESDALAKRMPSVTIHVTATGEPTVTIDGTAVPAASLDTKRPVDPGTHVVHAEVPGYASGDATFTVAKGMSKAVNLELVADSGGQRLAAILVLTAAGASLVLGVVTGGYAVSKHSQLAAVCEPLGCPPSDASLLGGYHTMATLSTIGIVTAGAAALTGTVLLLTAPKPPADPSAAWVAPVFGFGYAGVRGKF